MPIEFSPAYTPSGDSALCFDCVDGKQTVYGPSETPTGFRMQDTVWLMTPMTTPFRDSLSCSRASALLLQRRVLALARRLTGLLPTTIDDMRVGEPEVRCEAGQSTQDRPTGSATTGNWAGLADRGSYYGAAAFGPANGISISSPS